MRISHHWLLPAAVLVGSAAPFVTSLIASDARVVCSEAAPSAQGPACALVKRMIALSA